jgi:hypothetical protein
MSTELDQVKYVTIPLKPQTKQRVIDKGAKEDTYDDIINRLLDSYESKKPQ